MVKVHLKQPRYFNFILFNSQVNKMKIFHRKYLQKYLQNTSVKISEHEILISGMITSAKK